MTIATNPGATPAAPPAAPVASPTSTPAAPAPVPYDRFSEVVQQRNTVQQEKARLEGQLQQAQAIVQQAQGIIAQQQRPAPQAPPASEASDPWDQILDESLGTDEQGKEARRIMDIHAEQTFRKKGFITREEAVHIAQSIAQAGNNKIATAFQVTNHFQDMVQKGVISAQEAQGLQGQLNQHLSQSPDLANQPHNVMYLAKGLLADAITEGRIRPYSQPAPVNPLQGSGSVATTSLGDPLPPLDSSALKGFRTLRDKTPEMIKRVTERSIRSHQGATS